MSTESVRALEISGHLVARPFINNFPAHGISDIGHSIASGNESASHAMNPFTQDNLYAIGVLTQDNHVKGLPRCGDSNRDLLGVHTMVSASPDEPS